MYVALLLAFSLVFNHVAEKALRDQADKEVSTLLRNASPQDSGTYQNLRDEALRYHREDPWVVRVLRRAWDALPLRFSKVGEKTGLSEFLRKGADTYTASRLVGVMLY